jgi:hypothetical protein
VKLLLLLLLLLLMQVRKKTTKQRMLSQDQANLDSLGERGPEHQTAGRCG